MCKAVAIEFSVNQRVSHAPGDPRDLTPQSVGGRFSAIVRAKYGKKGEQTTCENPSQQLRQGTVQHFVALESSEPIDWHKSKAMVGLSQVSSLKLKIREQAGVLCRLSEAAVSSWLFFLIDE
jgi:hypothetical protein